MTPEQFCYWLQGFAEIAKTEGVTVSEWEQITNHLKTVFHKITPNHGGGGGGGGPHTVPYFPPQDQIGLPNSINPQRNVIC